MSYSVNDIYETIKNDKGLTRLLPLIDDVAILEYDGRDISGSMAVSQYLSDNGIDAKIIKRIVLFGKSNDTLNTNVNTLKEAFPYAIITITKKTWNRTDINKLKIRNILVLHMAGYIHIRAKHFEHRTGRAGDVRNIIEKTRMAYYACIMLSDYSDNFFENDCIIKEDLSLSGISLINSTPREEPTAFCKDKKKYIETCFKNLVKHDIFFQCIEEEKNGCESCNQCDNYESEHRCPMAQRYVAKCYREGIYVPQNEKIAHQWEIMAARQGYTPATIQVAEDLTRGNGCEKDVDKGISIYTNLAEEGNKDKTEKVITCGIENNFPPALAVRYITMLAEGGEESMVKRLSEAFKDGSYGLPIDSEQQKFWIQKGASNGNPFFVKSLADMYESKQDWKNAYHWYKKLFDYTDEYSDAYYVTDEKMDEIELKMLTNGKTAEDVAKSGRDYLFGWFGKERDTHLAYRCLKYASNAEIPMAIGLIGWMYCHGVEVEQDEDEGKRLLLDAASKDDLMSMYDLIKYFPEGSKESEIYLKYTKLFKEKTEEGIYINHIVAYYLKGRCLTLGFIYEKDLGAAFDNIKIAAEKGFPPAQYELALMYEEGKGTQIDNQLYIRWLRKSIGSGYYKAKGKFGLLCFHSDKYRNSRFTFKFLKDAYEQGYEDAQWPLAQCYMFGYGTDCDKTKAYPMYIVAAENGEVDAQEKLCEEYFHGNTYLHKDLKECARWGEEAIKNGCNTIRFETAYSSSSIGNHERAKELYLELSNEGNAAAMNNYACELSDQSEAVEWFRKSAENGDDYGYWNLGKHYRDGTGVEQDCAKAVELLTEAAEMGQKDAMLDLARMYRLGNGIEIDGEKAIEWYKKAIEKGEDQALMDIAAVYREGKIVPQNITEAIRYYNIAAEKGNVIALVELGKIFENGTDTFKKDGEKAIYWYRKAAIKGNKEAEKSIKRIKSNYMDENGNLSNGNEENNNISEESSINDW